MVTLFVVIALVFVVVVLLILFLTLLSSSERSTFVSKSRDNTGADNLPVFFNQPDLDQPIDRVSDHDSGVSDPGCDFDGGDCGGGDGGGGD